MARALSLCATAALLIGLAPSASYAAKAPQGFSGRVASPTAATWSWGVNGPVYAVAVVDGVLVVGGDFSAAVSRSGTTVPRHNLAAFSVSTGRLISRWVADTDGKVFALTASSSSVWVGGAFESIEGSERAHVAKLSLSDGDVDESFVLDTSGTVRALARDAGRLYAGGDFLYAEEKRHDHVVAADAASGVVDPAFQASAAGTVRALAQSGQRLYVGGRFQALSGVKRHGIGAVSTTSGATVGQRFRFPGVPGGAKGVASSVTVSPDGRQVIAGMGGTPKHGVGNQVVAWNATSGKPTWRVRLNGDGQAVKMAHGTVYVGFHRAYEGNKRLHLLAIDARSGAVSKTFRPKFSGFWGVHSIATTGRGVVVGGDFRRVDRSSHDRLAFFPFRSPR